MREIINPWLHMKEYNCFGCCPDNPTGVHMRFYREGDEIISPWKPNYNHQSWINTVHGGIQATLLDEVCGWVVFAVLHTSGYTAKMNLRYRKVVEIGQPYLLLKARLKSLSHHIAVIEGGLWNSKGELCASCECTYMTYDSDKAKEMAFREAGYSEQEYTLDEILKEYE